MLTGNLNEQWLSKKSGLDIMKLGASSTLKKETEKKKMNIVGSLWETLASVYRNNPIFSLLLNRNFSKDDSTSAGISSYFFFFLLYKIAVKALVEEEIQTETNSNFPIKLKRWGFY